MTDLRKAPPVRRTSWISAWFALDAIVALAPPLYWSVDGMTTPILGLPAPVFYFIAVSVFIQDDGHCCAGPYQAERPFDAYP